MSDKMTFSDFVERMAEASGSSKQLIHDFLKEIVDVTYRGLESDGQVKISGLGKFELRWNDERPGINPQTGEPIEIPAHNRIDFRPEAALRKFINREYEHLRPEFIEEKYQAAVPAELKEQAIPPIVIPKPIPAPAEQPAEETTVSDSKVFPTEEKRKSRAMPVWMWLILLILIVFIIYLLWPQPEPIQRVAEKSKTEENIAEGPSLTDDTAIETGKAERLADETPTEVVGTPGGTHNVQPGDFLWSISENYYNDGYLWPNIFRVNLSKIENPDVILVDREMEVPPLEGKVGSLSSRDIQNIADGYMDAYWAYRRTGNAKAQICLWVAKHCSQPEIFEKYKDRIDEKDLNVISKIKGSPKIK